MQQAGQVPHLDQNDAHEQSLGQSDGSLPGPEQTLNHSLTQHHMTCTAHQVWGLFYDEFKLSDDNIGSLSAATNVANHVERLDFVNCSDWPTFCALMRLQSTNFQPAANSSSSQIGPDALLFSAHLQSLQQSHI